MPVRFPSDKSKPLRFTEVNDLSALKATTKSISISAKLKNYQRLEELKSVEYISFSGAKLPVELAKAISSAPKLKSLIMMGLREISEPISSLSLTDMQLHWCSGLKDFAFLKKSKQIESIWCYACKSLESLNGLQFLKELRLFEIQGHLSIGALDSLKELKKLKKIVGLAIASHVKDKSLAGIASPELERLWLNHFFTPAEYVQVLKRCKKLKLIELHNGEFTEATGFKKNSN